MADRSLLILAATCAGAAAVYLAWGLQGPYGFILSLRATRLAALAIVGASVGAATVIFQTITANRLLTPGIVGFDSLFVLIQTLLVLGLGGVGYAALPAFPKFLVEILCLCAVAVALFASVLRAGSSDMTRLVLTGVILGVLMRGLTGFVQRLLDPTEFALAQAATFASFNSVDPVQVAFAAPILILALLLAWRLSPVLDVALLGRDGARSLGVDHERLTMAALAVVAMLVATSTAVAGPVTFLGLLAASLAAAALPHWRHAVLIPGAALTGALILIVGQFLFERLLGLQSTLPAIVESLGGLVFLVMVLKRRTA